ncbi:MAG TPA: Sir2 family NAD-dependent protein deacetylase [Actinomycetaceae bacterium]|nr:Sir2 family NAD-dependent protein deacetylase [Actinomycetaceae bacterium]
MSGGHRVEDFFPGNPDPPRFRIRNLPPPPAEDALPEPDDLDLALTPVLDVLSGHSIAVITGAGISTDSGIPDYRSPGSVPRTPMTIQQFMASERWRRHWWARNQVGWHSQVEAAPNAGHYALTELEQRGLITGVITQNIDRFHARAGTRNLVELHGRYDLIRCSNCGARFARSEVSRWLDDLNPGWVATHMKDAEIAPDADAVLDETEDFTVANCPRCGGILRADVVFFGDTVPPEKVSAAARITDDASSLLVAGSSLAVASALRFVRRAHRDDKPIVVVNRGATRADDLAAALAHVSTTRALPWLAERLPARC